MTYSKFIQSIKQKFNKKKLKKLNFKENNLNKTTKSNESKRNENVEISKCNQTNLKCNVETKKSRKKVSFKYIQMNNHVIQAIEQNNLDLLSHHTASSSSLVHISLTIYDGKILPYLNI